MLHLKTLKTVIYLSFQAYLFFEVQFSKKKSAKIDFFERGGVKKTIKNGNTNHRCHPPCFKRQGW
jgi:hypothetical protein